VTGIIKQADIGPPQLVAKAANRSVKRCLVEVDPRFVADQPETQGLECVLAISLASSAGLVRLGTLR
jgi:hypothetical protein